jgi:hypothetical protein
MIWADRAGVGVAALVFVALYILMGALGAANVDEAWPTLRVALVCGGLVWAVCRTLDFIFGGPSRRASKN